jgi:FAD/FMN-containing dehydrogenases
LPPQRNARIIVHSNGLWTNRHRNVEQQFQQLFDVSNPQPPTPDYFGDLRITVKALQGLIGSAIADGTTLRALGGGWSLSRAAVTDGRLVNTAPLNWFFPVTGSGLSNAFQGDPTSVFYLQCGVSVSEANDHLFRNDPQLALKTSGASNGQTIAGAVSTGTHGSAFGFGAMQDYVIGLHLITGPDRALWIERASRPVFSDALIADLGAEPIRDDQLFNDALVSFGSFGLLHGVAIEAEPLYLLEASRRRLPLDANLKHTMSTLDFTTIPMPHPNEVPFHFEVVVNPHDVQHGAYVTTMYKRPYRTDYPRPQPTTDGRGIGDDLLAIVGKLGDQIPAVVGPLLNLVIGKEYRLYAQQFGTPGEIFSANLGMQKAMSAEIGLALQDSVRALDLMLASPKVGTYPGVIAYRYVRGSRASLAFTKFPTTCTIEFPAGFAQVTVDFLQSVWNGLEQAAIPFTEHWGQLNNFTPGRVRAMYGDAAVDRWITSRQTLMDGPSRTAFSSAFLNQCGLG